MDSMKNMVSIIVPVYNVESYLRSCVDSLLKQTYTNIEIILIDDGATDNSGNICDDYLKIDSRIVVFHKANGGLSSARNYGLELARGDFISFVDSDDFVSPYFIEEMVDALVKTELSVCTLTGCVDFVDGMLEEKVFRGTSKCSSYVVQKSTETLIKMYYGKIPMGAPFKLCRKEIFDTIRFPVGYIYEDTATSYKYYLKDDNVVCLASNSYAYRIRKNSIITEAFSVKKLVAVEITETFIADVKEAYPNNKEVLDAMMATAFSLSYTVFLQIPWSDKENKKKMWTKIVEYRDSILNNKNPMMRKKDKFGAEVSLLGMNFAYILGQLMRRCKILKYRLKSIY